MLLVDYKVPYRCEDGFSAIINATKSLTRRLNYDGIVTASSHKFFDKHLILNHFINRPIWSESFILTNENIPIDNYVIRNRDFVYSTLADSDAELNFGN